MSPISPPGRLELHLQRTSEEVFEPDAVADAPLIRFVAYGGQQRVHGWIALRADRLTDLLNAHDELLLRDVELENLADGITGTVDAVLMHRAELLAVQAAGPRGDEGLRLETERHPLAVQVGSYLVGGYLHVPPGTDAMQNALDRPSMIPLTDAWIEHWVNGQREHQSIGTIVVNRDLAEWLRLVTEAELTDGSLRPV